MNYKPLKKIGIYEFLPIINREKQERRKGVRERRKGEINGGREGKALSTVEL